MALTRSGSCYEDHLNYHDHAFNGSLHLLYREFCGGVTVQDTDIDGDLQFHPGGTSIDGALNVRWSRMRSLDAAGVRTRYDLHAPGITLVDGLYASDTVIGRDLNYERGMIDGDVMADAATIDRYLNGRDGTVCGDVAAGNADIGRDADFRGGTIGGDLNLSGATIGHTLYLPDETGGVIDLSGAEIGQVVGELGGHDFRFDDETVIGDVRVSDR